MPRPCLAAHCHSLVNAVVSVKFRRAESRVLPMQFTHKFLLAGTPTRSEVLHTMCQVPSQPIRLGNKHTTATSNGLIASDGTYENPDKLFGHFQHRIDGDLHRGISAQNILAGLPEKGRPTLEQIYNRRKVLVNMSGWF